MIKRIFIGIIICFSVFCVNSCMGGGNYAVSCSWSEDLVVDFNEIRLLFPQNISSVHPENLTSFVDVFNQLDYSANISFTTKAEICSNEKEHKKIIAEMQYVDDNTLYFMPKAYGAESYAHTFEVKVIWENVIDEFGRIGNLIWQETYIDLMVEEDNPNVLVIQAFKNEGKFHLMNSDLYYLPIFRVEQFENIYY